MKKLTSIIIIFISSIFTSTIIQADSAMIVFDASGSMWGQVDGKNKISIAKQALEKVVTDWNEDTNLGFIAYGHRKKGDCNDIEVLNPIGKVNKKSLIAKVKRIQPKGKTPISRALKKAAEELKFTEEKATVILISDGKETCDADPCGTAKTLDKKGIDFVAHVIGFNVDKQTDKQLKCIADATGGEYFSARNASSLSNAMTQIVKKVEKAKPIVKNKKLEITAVEAEGGKWIKARHWIYKVTDGEAGKTYFKACTSTKQKACQIKTPVGQYKIQSAYSKIKKWTNFEVTSNEAPRVNVIMGQTGITNISTSENEGGKWVNSRHWIYPVVDGEKSSSYIIACSSTKKKACLLKVAVGSYKVETKYGTTKKWTDFEMLAGKSSLNIVMGQTGSTELTTSETEGGKWVNARHWVYSIVDGEKVSPYILSCGSTKKKACELKIPVGTYKIETKYGTTKKWTEFEMVAGKSSFNIVMGQTGSTELTTSEAEGGKWVNARHWVYSIVDGEKVSPYILSCGSTKKKACELKIPVGTYKIETKYGTTKKWTEFEMVAGKSTLNIIMGQTGKLELTAAEKEGGRWVKTRHWIYKTVDGKKEGSYIKYCDSSKSKACLIKIPLGSYIIESTFNKTKKWTPFEMAETKGQTLQVVFGKFLLGAKCADMRAKISYEVYANNGRMVFEKQATCADMVEAVIENGDYTVESAVNELTVETKISIGGDNPSKVIIDMRKKDKVEEPAKDDVSHKDLIDADVATLTPIQNSTMKKEKTTPDTSISKEKKAKLKAEEEKRALQALKKSIAASLSGLKDVKSCYQNANELNQANTCDALETDILHQALKTMGKSANDSSKVEARTQWDDDLKKTKVESATSDIAEMELSLTCIEKGANLSNLEQCIKNNGSL